MRNISRLFVVTASLFIVGLVSPSARANDALAGKFTLPHRTQWNSTVLPAGDYTFTLARTQIKDVNLLTVQGAKQKVKMFVYGEWACQTCQAASLDLAVRDNQFAVASMNMAGFHTNFKLRQPVGGAELVKSPQSSEQVAVHVDPN
jgi:hypothetical protein